MRYCPLWPYLTCHRGTTCPFWRVFSINMGPIKASLFRPKAHIICPSSALLWPSHLTAHHHSLSLSHIPFSLSSDTQQPLQWTGLVRLARFVRHKHQYVCPHRRRSPLNSSSLSFSFSLPPHCFFSLPWVAKPQSFSSPCFCCQNNLFLHQTPDSCFQPNYRAVMMAERRLSMWLLYNNSP